MFIEFRDLTYQYQRAEDLILHDISTSLAGPGFHGLFGPSGVGKSTLAKMIAGEIKSFTGKLTVSGISRILYSYNLERLPGWASIGEHITKVTPKGREHLRTELITSFGLSSTLDSQFNELSLGQRNRANLTRYLLQDFDLLIMDESMANVDEATRELIILKIKDLFPGKLFLYISHSVTEIAKFCRDIIVLRSVSKKPQAVKIGGRDIRTGQSIDGPSLERSMLEVVNAS